MPTIDQHIAIRPGGNLDSLQAFYGKFSYRESSVQRGIIIPDSNWESQNIVLVPSQVLPGWPRFPTANGLVRVRGVRLHKRVVEPLTLTWQEVVRRGLAAQLLTYDGAYMPRHMLFDPQRLLSVHAFGAAIDFDARWNGYGLARNRIRINPQIVAVFKQFGWCWGGDWNPTDAMHFQWTDPV